MDLAVVTADSIHTMDSRRPRAEAVLVEGGRIVAAGGRDELDALAGPDIRRSDFPGAVIIPGLVESHVHPVTTGLAEDMADCRPESCGTIAEIQAALRKQPPGPGGWIRGWGYDDTLVAEQRHPLRAELDEVGGDSPVLITHSSGHFAVANSAALERAGISEESVATDDPGFPRDGDGQLSGMAWEIDAVVRLTSVIPPPTREDLELALVRTLCAARRRGITTVHDLAIGGAGGIGELEVYRDLDAAGELPVRVAGYLRGHLALPAIRAGEAPSFRASWNDGSRFTLAGVKLWADGSIQGLSAALRTPYLCDAGHTGALLCPQAELDAMVRIAQHAGAQVAIHANGDAAVAAAIEALGRARSEFPGAPRHRIEHCQVTDPADLDAMMESGLCASFFVNHVYFWGDRHAQRFLGPERAAVLDPLAYAEALGMRFGLHSDCPVTPMDPLATIRTAATRLTRSGTVLGPDQRIDVLRALRAMTADSAHLVHDEDRGGSLAPGKRADLVVLDGPVEDLADPALSKPEPARVMIDGQWSGEDNASSSN